MSFSISYDSCLQDVDAFFGNLEPKSIEWFETFFIVTY